MTLLPAVAIGLAATWAVYEMVMYYTEFPPSWWVGRKRKP